MCHLVQFSFDSGDAEGVLQMGAYRGSPELFKQDIMSMSETGVSFSSVWF